MRHQIAGKKLGRKKDERAGFTPDLDCTADRT